MGINTAAPAKQGAAAAAAPRAGPGDSQGPVEQKGWRLAALLGTLHEHLLGREDAARYVLRAVLFLGRSYALPVVPTAEELAALQPLLGHERFFVDVLYMHAPDGEPVPVVGGGAAAGGAAAAVAGRKAEPPRPPVEVVDVLGSDDEDEDEGVPKVSAVPTVMPKREEAEKEEEQATPSLEPVRSQAQAIWAALTGLFGDRHPYLPQRDFLFEVPLVSGAGKGCAAARCGAAPWLILFTELMLSHPFQRDGQVGGWVRPGGVLCCRLDAGLTAPLRSY